jgi:hypothetical protein
MSSRKAVGRPSVKKTTTLAERARMTLDFICFSASRRPSPVFVSPAEFMLWISFVIEVVKRPSMSKASSARI